MQLLRSHHSLTPRLLAALLAVATPLVAAAQTGGASKTNGGPIIRPKPGGHSLHSLGVWQKSASSTLQAPKFNYCVRVSLRNIDASNFDTTVTALLGYYGIAPVNTASSASSTAKIAPDAGTGSPGDSLPWILVHTLSHNKSIPVGATRLLDGEACENNVAGTPTSTTRLVGFVGAGESRFPYYGEQINFGYEVPTSQDLRALIRSPKFATNMPRTLTDKPRGVTPKANLEATPPSAPVKALTSVPKSP